MKRMLLNGVIVSALAIAAGSWLAESDSAQAAAAARPMPMFEVVKDWPKLPATMKVGDASSFAIDAQDNVWLIHRPHTLKGDAQKMAAKPVVVFSPAGDVVKQWGGEGQGYEWPQREHGIFIDYQGNVWLGGNNCPGNGAPTKPVNDDQLLKFSQDGRFLLQIGKVNGSKGNADTANLHRPADAQVYQPTNELFVADGYGNDRVIVFDAQTGAYKRMWGAFGKAAKDEDSCEVATPKTFASPGPDNFNVVHAIRVSKDGMVYVADRENRRVQVFDMQGKYINQIIRTDVLFARNLALSPDADQQFLYVGGGKGVFVVDRKSLAIIGSVEPAGIVGPGHQINVDSKGNLYIAATGMGMQKLAYKGMSK